jgi:hypothetical protein
MLRVLCFVLVVAVVGVSGSSVLAQPCSSYGPTPENLGNLDGCGCYDDTACGWCYFDEEVESVTAYDVTMENVGVDTVLSCSKVADISNAVSNGIRTDANGCPKAFVNDANGDATTTRVRMRFDARRISRSDCETSQQIMALIGPAVGGCVVVLLLLWFFTRGRWWWRTNHHHCCECALWCCTWPLGLCFQLCEGEAQKKQREERHASEKEKRQKAGGKSRVCLPVICICLYDCMQPKPAPHDMCYCCSTNKNNATRIAFLYPKNPCGCLPCYKDDENHPCGLGCACLCSCLDSLCCEDQVGDGPAGNNSNKVGDHETEMLRQQPGEPE